jgi:hypothetical protein
MFFRRQPVQHATYAERVKALVAQGCEVSSLGGGLTEVRRGRCAAVIQPDPAGAASVVRLGVLVGGEIAALVDGGFQKFFRTASGTQQPARAEDLRNLHDFQDDLYQALGIGNLYNTSLGTVCDRHAYDRLSGRS